MSWPGDRNGPSSEEGEMDLQLNGRTALVTGSTAGIGLAIATRLAVEGAEVAICGRSPDKLDQAVRAIAAHRPSGTVCAVLGDPATFDGAGRIAEELPEVDILVNNLGIYESKAFDAITDEDWRRIFEVNVLSGARLARQYLPGMLQRNWGRIIFVSSDSALVVPPDMIHYAMTKTAQLTISRGLAELTRGTGVTVNAAGDDALGRDRRLHEERRVRSGRAGGGDRGRVLRKAAADLADPADDRAGRDRGAGRLRGEPARLGHQWCGDPRRWRHRADDRVSRDA
jgi:NAD(P)-dependent dehydrogenase (short-subunit alcohol dehydrogenase family)